MSKKNLEIKLKNKKEETKNTSNAIHAVRMVSLLTLRNKGWGAKRLKEFDEEWYQILADVSHGHLSLTDIAEAIYIETGLKLANISNNS